MKKIHYGKDISFLFIESTLTSFTLFMPVAYLLFKDLGLNQFQIGLTQFIFMMTLLILEVPTGYFADSVSRKISNASGDVFMAVGTFTYFLATGFWHAVIAEILFGIGYSLTSGADSALLRAHAEDRGLDYHKLAARLESFKFVVSGVGAIVGAYIGARNIRWPFIVQTLVFVLATFVAFSITNKGKVRKTDKHPIKDVISIVKYCLRGHTELAWRIFIGAGLMSSTYLMVWFMTPSFLQAGIAIKYHGILFALISVLAIFGSEFIAHNKKLKIITPLLITAVAYLSLGLRIGNITVFIFLLTSFARGINTSRIKPYIQEVVPDDIQATALSVYGMVYRAGSASLGLLVNYIGNFKLQYGLIAAGMISIVMWFIFKFNENKYDI